MGPGEVGATLAPVSKSKTLEKIFPGEIEAGTVPGLQTIKEQMHVGTDRARTIRDQLAETMQEATQAA